MRRLALDNVELSDGTNIPRGSHVAVSGHQAWDSKTYENPLEWDGRRFLRLRETPGGERAAELVSTGAEHLGFGHGFHACPGRFFAADEIKIMLSQMLLQYDWRLPEGAPQPVARHAFFHVIADPSTQIEYRRRTPEIPT
jgi:cytochrome P450